MFEWIAGLGLRAMAGKALGSVGSGISSGVGATLKWLGSLDLIHALALGLAIAASYEFVVINGLEFKLIPFLGPKIHVRSLKGQIADANAETDKADAALAAALDKLSASEKNEASLRAEIGRQNAAIADLGNASTKQQQVAAKAELLAAGRAQGAMAVADALRASAAQKPAPGAPCEPSKTLKDAWK